MDSEPILFFGRAFIAPSKTTYNEKSGKGSFPGAGWCQVYWEACLLELFDNSKVASRQAAVQKILTVIIYRD